MNAALVLLSLCLGASAEDASALRASDAAAPEPIVVVAEVGFDEPLTPTALRDAIARELRVPVLSPSDEGASSDAPTMTIALAPTTVVVALTQGGSTLRRSITLPRDRAGRLRLITWLAGNMARDQAAGLLDGERRSHHLLAFNEAEDTSAAASGVRARSVNDLASLSNGPAPAQSVVASAQRPEAPATDWSVALVTGPELANVSRLGRYFGYRYTRETDIEVTRGSGRWVVGGTVGTSGPESVRAGLLLGWRMTSRWFRPEMDAVVGLGFYPHTSASVQRTSDSFAVTTTTVAEAGWPPGIFVRVSSGIAIGATDWLEIVTRVNAVGQLTAERYTASVTAGLRCRLP